MNAAGENSCLDRSAITACPDNLPAIDLPREARQQPSSLFVRAHKAGKRGRSTQRSDVVRGVARAAGHDFGGVIFENQHRRLARHAVHFSVNELVRDEIADDQHTTAAEVVDERQQARFAFGFTGQRVDRASDEHSVWLQASGFGLQASA